MSQVEPEPKRNRRQAAILTARIGLIQGLLLIVSIWLLTSIPGPRASDQELIDFYTSGASQVVMIAGLYVLPLAAIAFLWFAVALRVWISDTAPREEVLLSTVQLVSAVVFVALLLTGAAAETVLAVGTQASGPALDVVLTRQFVQYGSTLLLVFALRMAAMFVITTTTIARKHDILPKWFVWTGYAVGLFLLLTANLDRTFALVFPVWVLILSGILLQRARGIRPDLAAV